MRCRKYVVLARAWIVAATLAAAIACTQAPDPGLRIERFAEAEPSRADGPPYPETTAMVAADRIEIRVENVRLREAAELAARRAHLVVENSEALPDKRISLEFKAIAVGSVMEIVADEAHMGWVQLEDRIRFGPRRTIAAGAEFPDGSPRRD